MNDSEDRPDLVDTLLRERAGVDAQPDLTDAVLARLQRGEAAVQAGRLRWEREPFARRSRTWIAAAVLLLGLGVVAAVAFTRREDSSAAQQPAPPQAQDPAPNEQKPVDQDPAKDQPLAFTLRVVGPDGAPVPRMSVRLMSVYRTGPAILQYSPVMGFDELKPGTDKGGSTTGFSVRETATNEREIRGTLHNGEYAVEVESELHSRTTSKPFAIGNGKAPPLVEVTMTPCHELRLQIATVHGKPIGGAVVTTKPSRAELGSRTADGKVLLSIGDLFPPILLSTLRAESNPNGTVSLRGVTPGKHLLVFEHPDYCTTVLDPVEVPLAAPLEPVRMIPGSVVRGTVQGKPEAVAGAKLTLSPKAGTIPNAGLWPMVTHANAKGEFTFDSKVPPGTYLLTPVRQPSTEHLLIDANGVMRDSVELVVEEGQTEVKIDPRLRGN